MRDSLVVVGVGLTVLIAVGLVFAQGGFDDGSNDREMRIEVVPLQTDANTSFHLEVVNGTDRLRTTPESAAIRYPDGRNFIGLELRQQPVVRQSNLDVPDQRIEEAIDMAISKGTIQSTVLTGAEATDAEESLVNNYGGGRFVVYAGPQQAVFVQYTIEE